MAHPPNPNPANPAQNAPGPGTTLHGQGGANQPPPSGPTRKVKVVIVGTLPTPTFHLHDVCVSVVDRAGNPITETVRVAISGLSVARQVTATNGIHTEQVSVPAGLSGVVYRAVLPNGETDSKDLSAPAAPATPHHPSTAEKFRNFLSSSGWAIASAICGLIALLFLAGAFLGPYGLDLGESETRKLLLGVFFAVAAAFLFVKAFGGHTPSGGGH